VELKLARLACDDALVVVVNCAGQFSEAWVLPEPVPPEDAV